MLKYEKPRFKLIEATEGADFFALYKRITRESIEDLPRCRPLDHSMALSLDSYVTQKLPLNELRSCLFQGGRIEVHGIYPEHSFEVLSKSQYRNLEEIRFRHNSRSKAYNFVRPRYFNAFKDGVRIIILAITPGRDYVRHYGALVRHFISTLTNHPEDVLSILRYPDAETKLTCWSGLERNFVQDGDHVVMGYVEELVTIFTRRYKLKPIHEYENEFYHSICFRFGTRRINLIGVKFSYWGDMAAKIADKVCRLGSSELIYAAKLGALTNENDLYHRIFSPSRYVTMDYLSIKSVVTKLDNNLLKTFPHLESGFHISVPTVLEEDYRQREAASLLGANTIDNEISQIAFAVHSHNQLEGTRVAFSALHFATDYLRSSEEKSLQAEHDLSTNRSARAVALKNQSISKIAELLVTYFGASHA